MSLLALHPFPIFVRDLPRRNAMQSLLISLQANYHLNANVLLYCLWFALTEQGRLRRPEFKKLEAALHPWHERIVLALQQLVDSLGHSAHCQQWVAAEVEIANQFEQQMLAQMLPGAKKLRRNLNQQLQDASYNLVAYYKIMRIYVDGHIRSDTLEILRCCFDSPEQQIVQSLEQALTAACLDDTGFTQLALV